MTPLDPEEARREPEPDLGTLATPKRQEVLAPDLRPASELRSLTRPPGSTAGPGVGGSREFPGVLDETERVADAPCPLPDQPMFEPPELDADLREGRYADPRKPKNDSKGKRRQRKRQKARQTARIQELQFRERRILRVAAAALERVQVADEDSSGAVDEAEALLKQIVTLDGQYVCERVGCGRPHDAKCVQTGTTPGGTWEYTCGHLIGK